MPTNWPLVFSHLHLYPREKFPLLYQAKERYELNQKAPRDIKREDLQYHTHFHLQKIQSWLAPANNLNNKQNLIHDCPLIAMIGRSHYTPLLPSIIHIFTIKKIKVA